MEQTAGTTLTIVQAKTAATAVAKMASTRTRACAVLGGTEQTARLTSTSALGQTAATVTAKIFSTNSNVSALLDGKVLIARLQVDAQLAPTNNRAKTMALQQVPLDDAAARASMATPEVIAR